MYRYSIKGVEKILRHWWYNYPIEGLGELRVETSSKI
jgi:hypothetical protein